MKVLAECIFQQQRQNQEDRKSLDVEEKILDGMLAYLAFSQGNRFSSNISDIHLFEVEEFSDLFSVKKENDEKLREILREKNKGYFIEGKIYYPLHSVIQKSLREIVPLTLFYRAENS